MYGISEDDEDYEDYYDDMEYNPYEGIYDCFDFYEHDLDSSDKECDCSIRYGNLKYSSKPEIRQLERCKDILENIRNSRSNDGSFCDAIIKVEDKEFPVHKIILTSNSTYFEAMFTRPFNEQTEKCINLKGVTKDIFAILIDFLYGANIEFSEETLLGIYQAADMFCIDSLTVECNEYLKDNWRMFKNNIYTLVELMNAEEVQKEMLDEIYEGMTSKHDFDKLATEPPFSFIEKLMQKANSEVTALSLVNLLIKWVSTDPKNRLCNVEYIAKTLTLNLLPWSAIEEFQSKMEDLFEKQNLHDQKESFKDVFKSRCDEIMNKISSLGLQIYMVFVEEKFDAKIDCFNCEDFKWSPSSNIKLPFEIQNCLYNSGNIYFMGNKKSLRYTPNTRNVEFLREMKDGRLNYSACFFKNDIIIAGGVRDNPSKEWAKNISRYQSSNNAWQSVLLNWNKPSMESSLITSGENVYIVGGRKVISTEEPIEDPSQFSGDIFKFIPKKRKFSRVCKLDRPTFKPHLSIFDNKLYVFRRSIDLRMWIPNPEVVDLETGLNSYIHIQSLGAQGVLLLATCSTDDGILLIYSTILNEVDHVCIVELKSSGIVERIGFLPRQPSVSPSAKNEGKIQKWCITST